MDLNHGDPNNNASDVANCKTGFDYFVVSDFRSFAGLPFESEKARHKERVKDRLWVGRVADVIQSGSPGMLTLYSLKSYIYLNIYFF